MSQNNLVLTLTKNRKSFPHRVLLHLSTTGRYNNKENFRRRHTKNNLRTNLQRYTKEVRIVITATAATRHTMDEKEIERRKKGVS